MEANISVNPFANLDHGHELLYRAVEKKKGKVEKLFEEYRKDLVETYDTIGLMRDVDFYDKDWNYSFEKHSLVRVRPGVGDTEIKDDNFQDIKKDYKAHQIHVLACRILRKSEKIENDPDVNDLALYLQEKLSDQPGQNHIQDDIKYNRLKTPEQLAQERRAEAADRELKASPAYQIQELTRQIDAKQNELTKLQEAGPYLYGINEELVRTKISTEVGTSARVTAVLDLLKRFFNPAEISNRELIVKGIKDEFAKHRSFKAADLPFDASVKTFVARLLDLNFGTGDGEYQLSIRQRIFEIGELGKKIIALDPNATPPVPAIIVLITPDVVEPPKALPKVEEPQKAPPKVEEPQKAPPKVEEPQKAPPKVAAPKRTFIDTVGDFFKRTVFKPFIWLWNKLFG